jgi:hypothetical protein
MKLIANQTLHSPPNVLQGSSIPNTLGGVGPADVAVGLQRPRPPYMAAASVVVAAVALVFLLWRP